MSIFHKSPENNNSIVETGSASRVSERATGQENRNKTKEFRGKRRSRDQHRSKVKVPNWIQASFLRLSAVKERICGDLSYNSLLWILSSSVELFIAQHNLFLKMECFHYVSVDNHMWKYGQEVWGFFLLNLRGTQKSINIIKLVQMIFNVWYGYFE